MNIFCISKLIYHYGCNTVLTNFLESRSGVAKSPEGLAPVRAIFAHGSEEVSIKVSDEGGGNLTTWKRSLCD